MDVWRERGRVRVGVEEHAPAAWFEGLEKRGHVVTRLPSWSGDLGHAHIIAVEGGASRRPTPEASAALRPATKTAPSFRSLRLSVVSVSAE